jgi:PP-loop superfamily ATP-utilizing enzyme
VRHHGETARIEVEPRDFDLVRNREKEIAAKLKALGFPITVIDPHGYQTTNVSVPRTIVRGSTADLRFDPVATAPGTDTLAKHGNAS